MESYPNAHETVEPGLDLKAHLVDYVRALMKLFDKDVPAEQTCQAAVTLLALYLWGDARRAGLGSVVSGDNQLEHELSS